jgi:hypothetical protein
MASTNLAAALVVAQRNLPGVLKDAANTFHRYKYVSSESMIRECRAALHDAGLALIPVSETMRPAPELAAFGAAAVLSASWELFHGPSGESTPLTWEWPIVPEKGRPLDKALASARTTGLGYGLRDLLLAPRVDHEDEMDWSGRERHPEAAPSQATGKGIKAPAAPAAPAAPTKPGDAPPAVSQAILAAVKYLEDQGVPAPMDRLVKACERDGLDPATVAKPALSGIVKALVTAKEAK